MTAAEQKLAARMAELQTLQKKLEGLDAAQKQKAEAGWQGLVKLYETMKPKDAATIFNDLSDAGAVAGAGSYEGRQDGGWSWRR